MITLKGVGVSDGVTFGEIFFYNKNQNKIEKHRIENVEKEVEKYEKAKETALEQLQNLYDKTLENVNEDAAMIFEVHQLMLNDGDYNDSIVNIITNEKFNAEYAVLTTKELFAKLFSEMDDEYMQERATDVHDISERVINILMGIRQTVELRKSVILATDDLAPSETIQLDKEKLLAFVTIEGSTNSHTAILARLLNIPAIVGVGSDFKKEFSGKQAIIDGFTGEIYIEPDKNTKAKMKQKANEHSRARELLETLKGCGNVTLDGRKIDIFANVSGVDGINKVLENDAGGIGLFRSEFLYLQSDTYPTEEEQFNAYKTVAQELNGKKVVIRTLDIGADKQIDYFNLPSEENPALGLRAIRICLERPDIFKTQLRAIFRASAFGNVAIMFPMIISVEEVVEIKQIATEVKQELRSQNIEFSDSVEIGIMIETPASVMISDILAKEVDFFSIGTNDLFQYTLAIDRQNLSLDRFYNPHHPAILRMIKMVAENAHKEGKWIGICGELASDLDLTEEFLKIGIDKLSVSPSYVLPLREKVRSLNIK
ncbi:MAG: phosphoenolpyruvate--protein phosphotransferase [Defluviitaleaceae bacterium]|nr:phosphoenolpyruvate--protein phosphotransferase [Defluviitaleaceae bacterium]